MIRRPIPACALVLVLLASPSLGACSRKVEVQTGTRTVCTYGHPISDDVTTVEVPAKSAAEYKVRTVTRTCAKHSALEKLYAEAQAALAAGDIKTARAKLNAVVKGDASFGSASDQLDTINDGGRPRPDTGTPGSSSEGSKTTDPGKGDISGPVGSLARFTPDELSGFAARKPLTDPNSLIREYIPTGSSKAIMLVIIAEQTMNAKVAALMLSREVKSVYPNGGTTVRAGGRNVYFGTDSANHAGVGFTDGSVFVVLEITAKAGVDPKSLKDTILAAAGQLP